MELGVSWGVRDCPVHSARCLCPLRPLAGGNELLGRPSCSPLSCQSEQQDDFPGVVALKIAQIPPKFPRDEWDAACHQVGYNIA